MRVCISLICGVLMLTACQPAAENIPVRWRHMALGTWVDITVYGAEDVERNKLRLNAVLDEAHRTWHAWHPSALTKLNDQLQAGACASLDPQMNQLVRLAQQMYVASGGLFDAGIGKLLSIWGFQKDEWVASWQPPTAEAVQQWLANRPGVADLYWQGNRLCSRNPEVALDFGGFAKGFALQLVSQGMQQLAWHNHMVNGGGDIVVSGLAGHRPWRIAIRDPQEPGKALAVLEVQGDSSVFTSGTYERKHQHQGKSYHHILDPRTGYPADGIVSATVVGKDPAWADAAATALLIGGKDCAGYLASRMKIDAWLLIDATGKAYLNKAMQDRIHWLKKVPISWSNAGNDKAPKCKL